MQIDAEGNLPIATDAHKVTYAYAPEGWLSAVTKADGAVPTYQYDKTGSLLTQNVDDGRTISGSYNELGMVTKVTSEEGTIVYQYNGQGYLVSVTNVNEDAVTSALPDVAVQVQFLASTAYGEQMGTQKVSGFAYNGA